MSQVPYDLTDHDTPDDWECRDNKWDQNHASCSVPQELTDKEIDEILALQVTHAESALPEHFTQAWACISPPACLALQAECQSRFQRIASLA